MGSRSMQSLRAICRHLAPISLSVTILLASTNPRLAFGDNSPATGNAASSVVPPQPQSAQNRVGGLDPSDYADEAGELEVMTNQQQIPTAQLMAAAGHLVPENFFLPGGSIPAPAYHQMSRFTAHLLHQQQLQQQQQQQHQQQQASQSQQQQQPAIDPLQPVSSHLHPRSVSPAAVKYNRAADLLATVGQLEPQESSQLIDYASYNLATQPDPRDSAPQVDLAEFLAPSSGQPGVAAYEQQQHYANEQQLASELAAVVGRDSQHHHPHNHHHHHQQVSQHSHQQMENLVAQASETAPEQYAAGSMPQEHQINGMSQQELAAYGYSYGPVGGEKESGSQKPFGLPTRSSNKEPHGMLKPLGNPKIISSPAIDLVANQLPKTSNFEKLAEKIPPMQTPTVFSFSSSKDPVEKVKAVNQKKRNVMKQAEHLARMMIKSVNDKFGTNIGDQTDLPFLLSSLGPVGWLQNVLFDPTLLVTLLNSAEKTYFSDVLPGPAKAAVRPVLNIFRVPNKKRDKANILNVISYLASGGQVGTPSKHRQGTGIEKTNKHKYTS